VNAASVKHPAPNSAVRIFDESKLMFPLYAIGWEGAAFNGGKIHTAMN